MQNTRLSEIFNNQDFLRKLQGSLTTRPRKDDEHIDVYVAEIRHLVSQAFPDYTIPQQEAATYRRFVKGVSNFLRAKIYKHGPPNLNEAIRVCKNVERARSELSDPQLEQPILLPQPIVAQIDDVHKPQDQTDIILTELLDEFKKMSTISSELKRQGDAIQHLSNNQNRDHYYQNRSRDFSRRRNLFSRFKYTTKWPYPVTWQDSDKTLYQHKQ